MKIAKSTYSYVICCLFLLAGAFYEQKWNLPGSNALINWDVFGYYYYLPALFYDNLCELNNWKYIFDNYAPSPYFNQAILQPNGCYVMKYSSGMAFMYLPAFIVAHFWAKLGGYAVDGLSFPYQFTLAMWGIAVAWIGMWFIKKTLLKYFEDKAVAVVLLLLCFATNYFAYTSLTGSMSHNYLFTVYALIIYFSDKWHKSHSLISSIIIGLLCGLATLTRPTEIISLIIPLLWGIYDFDSFMKRLNVLKIHAKQILIAAICFFAVVFIQSIYWKVNSGKWLYYSYEEQGFSFLSPHFSKGLFSYRKGWLLYTPAMIFSIIGFYQLYKYKKQLFPITLLFFLVFMYIAFSWDIWWYGGSFSQRAMIQCYPVLLFPFTAFIQYNFFTRWNQAILSIIFIFCIWLNIFQTWQAANGILECDDMNKAYYWKTFGKTKINNDDRRFLDTNEKIPDNLVNQLTEIFSNDFETDDSAYNSYKVYSGKKGLELNKEMQSSSKYFVPVTGNEKWFRAKAKMFYWDKEWNFWWGTQFIIQLIKDDEIVKTKLIRVHRISEPNNWQEIYVDIKAEGKTFNKVAVSVWNANGDKTIYVDDLKIFSAN